jgi:hypothetical protein
MSVSAPKSTIMLIKIVGGDKQILEVNERRNENRRSDVFLRRSWLKTTTPDQRRRPGDGLEWLGAVDARASRHREASHRRDRCRGD